MRPGSWLNDISLVYNVINEDNAIALEDCHIISLSKDHFNWIFKDPEKERIDS